MIDKSLHLIWLPPIANAAIPVEIQVIADLWRANEPNIAIKLWQEAELAAELADVDGRPVWKAVEKCRFPSMQADIASLALVYKSGGFWSGLKNRPLTTFVESLSELDGFVVTEHFPVESRPDPTGFLCNGFFGAKKGDVFVLNCLDKALSNIEARIKASPPKVSGSAMMMEICREQNKLILQDIIVLNYADVWGHLLKRIALPYDKNDMHWSRRYKREDLYVET